MEMVELAAAEEKAAAERKRAADEQRAAAKAANVPPYVVFSDATLGDLIDRWPTEAEGLLAVHGIGPTKADRHGVGILAVLAAHDRPEAADPPANDSPSMARTASKTPTTSTGDSPLHDRLRAWRTERARGADGPPYRVVNNTTLDALAEARPTDVDGLLAVPGIGHRKVEDFGAELLALLADG